MLPAKLLFITTMVTLILSRSKSQARLQTSQGSQNRLSLFRQRQDFFVDRVKKTRNKELEN